MKHRKLSQAVDLWNKGRSISEISAKTGIPPRDLGKGLLDATERAVRLRKNVLGRR